jgi:putative two-component system response regulator
MQRPEKTVTEKQPSAPSPYRVLIVDDDQGVLHAVRRLLGKTGYEVLIAGSPMEAVSVMQRQEVAVVISDHMMPGMSGIELLTLVRQNWPATVGIMMTACGDIKVAADVVNNRLVNYFINKPWDSKLFITLVKEAVEVHRALVNNPGGAFQVDATLLRNIREQASKAAFSLARAVDARDRYTHRHSENVSALSVNLGRALGLDDAAIEELRMGGLLHDVGKIGVSDNILLKPSRLTEDEYKAIKTHPVIGVSIIEPIRFPWNIEAIIRQHHENHDGSGYPDGLQGDEIFIPARVIHVVDAYEAMSSDRVYRKARPLEWIEAEIARCRGTQFDPNVIDVFLIELRAGRLPLP